MEQTVFYVAGGVLVVLAVAVAVFGLRSPRFPSGPTLGILAAVFTLVVVVTATAAVVAARDEQGARLEEQNREAAEEAESGAEAAEEEKAPEGTGEAAEPPEPAPADQLALGQQVFADTGCGVCHTLAAAASTGEIGPNLDETLIAQDPAFIRESIVDPDASIADGFPPGTMPQNYGTQLSDEQLSALVTFVSESTSAGN